MNFTPKRLDVDRLLYFLHRHHALLHRLTHLADHRLQQFRFEVQEILVVPRRTVAGNDHIDIELAQRPQALACWLSGGVKYGTG